MHAFGIIQFIRAAHKLAWVFALELILFWVLAIKQLCDIPKLMQICGERTSGRLAWGGAKAKSPLRE